MNRLFLHYPLAGLGIHLACLLLSYFVLFTLGLTQLPDNNNLMQWDAGWYHSIVTLGYSIDEQCQSNIVFFPLFPYFWKLTDLGAPAISVCNYLLFLISFAFLSKQFKANTWENLLLLSTPSLLFMLVPYSEAWFFAGGTLLLIGLKNDRLSVIITGLIVCSLVRSAASLFLPVILFMEGLQLLQTQSIGQTLKRISLYLGTLVLGVLLVAWLQYAELGIWFGFIKSQSLWDHHFRLPIPLFHTWEEQRNLWIDGLALWVGLMTTGWCIFQAVKWLKGRPLLQFKGTFSVQTDRAVIFSMAYCTAVTLYILFFQSPSLHSLNRYLFCTPYFMVVALYFFRQRPKNSFYILAAVLTVGLWFAIGAHKLAGRSGLLFGVMSYIFTPVFIAVHLFFGHPRVQSRVIWVLYPFNLILQISYYQVFLQDSWVG